MNNHNKSSKSIIIAVGVFISIGLFTILFVIRYYKPFLLDIDAKWLLIGSAPVLIALILSGIIKIFKGFGVEFEVEISKLDIQDGQIIEHIKPTRVTPKGALTSIYDMNDNDINNITILSFVYGKKNYYDSDAVYQYFNRLENLKYLLFVNENNRFLFMIRMDQLRLFINSDLYNVYTTFIRDIENKRILNSLQYYTITQTLKLNTTVIDSVKIFKKEKQEELPVVDDKFQFCGLAARDAIYEAATDILVKHVG